MTDKTLKEAIQDQYKAVQLTDDQLNQLDQLQAKHQVNKQVSGKKSSINYYGLAAAITVTLLLGLMFGSQFTTFNSDSQDTIAQGESSDLFRRVAEEVTLNHRKLRPLEVTTNSFDEIRGYFTQLDFRPSSSNIFNPKDSTLIGGRYCSIEGITAAQIRYQNSAGEMTTLYETAYKPSVFKGFPNVDQGKQPIIQYTDGYKVSLWMEKGLIMAAVTAPE